MKHKNLMIAAAALAAFYVYSKNRVTTATGTRSPIVPSRPLASTDPVSGLLGIIGQYINKPGTSNAQSAVAGYNYSYGTVGNLPAFSIFPDAIIGGVSPSWNSDNANGASYGTFGNYGADQGALTMPQYDGTAPSDLMNWYG